ncbi:sry-box containing protein 7 [Moniliophthora roreri MCA 2997]|uniref:Sry-box containing protein 7 n=2 Tax=Moniliophthora roreri TaxID=221103 RepID=V2XB54_MONRO|nr:sry-box containing protein 7 [Moniliophthora roreri MCA 2997]
MHPRSRETSGHSEGFEAKLPPHLIVTSTDPTTSSVSATQPQAGPSNLGPSAFTSPMYYTRPLSPNVPQPSTQNTQMLQIQNTRQPLHRSTLTVSAGAEMGIPEMGSFNANAYPSSSQYPFSPINYEGPEAQPTSRSRSRRKKVEEQHIPRPMNSFMLFRADFVKTRKGQELSKLASKVWKAMSEDEKRPWKEEAERVKKKHQQDYPHYQFRPVHMKRGRRTPAEESRETQSSVSTSPGMQMVSDSFPLGDPLDSRSPVPSWNTGTIEPGTSGEQLASPYGAIPTLNSSHQEQRISTPRALSGTPETRTLLVQELQNGNGVYPSCEQAASSPFPSSARPDIRGWCPPDGEEYATLHPYHDPVNHPASGSSTAAFPSPAVSTSLAVPPTSPYAYSPSTLTATSLSTPASVNNPMPFDSHHAPVNHPASGSSTAAFPSPAVSISLAVPPTSPYAYSPSTLTATSLSTPASVYNPMPFDSSESFTESQETWESWALLLEQRLHDPTLAAQNPSEIPPHTGQYPPADTGWLSPMTSPMLTMGDDFGVGQPEQEEGQYNDDIGSLFQQYKNS